jgi:ribosomal protein S25
MTATAAPRQRWTPAEEKRLLSAAKGLAGKDLANMFDEVAAERGVSPSTVRSKYYALKKPRKGARGSWSKRAANQLVREASAVSGRARTKVFEEWAERRGVSVGAIQQKYYHLARDSKADAPEPAAAQPARNGNASSTSDAPAATATGNRELEAMTMLELAQLGRRVSDELERRISSVASLWA